MPPPKKIPIDLLAQFTAGNKIKVSYCYRDDSTCRDMPRIYTKQMVDDYVAKIANRKKFYYGETDVYC